MKLQKIMIFLPNVKKDDMFNIIFLFLQHLNCDRQLNCIKKKTFFLKREFKVNHYNCFSVLLRY